MSVVRNLAAWMKRGLRRLVNSARVLRLRARGIHCPWSVQLESGVRTTLGIYQSRKGSITIGPGCRLCRGVIIDAWGGSVVLGASVHLGPYTVLYGHGGITIGDDCLIGPQCTIVAANHTVPGRDQRIRSQPDRREPITIAEDCWLGSSSTVLAGVTIGRGSVVAAQAVVTRDVPDFALATGVPARIREQIR
ncbi:MAG: acyltransferase [Xanthomonadales bacterium]|nr:acyltransferase [Xanthomonadales bacterium]